MLDAANGLTVTTTVSLPVASVIVGHSQRQRVRTDHERDRWRCDCRKHSAALTPLVLTMLPSMSDDAPPLSVTVSTPFPSPSVTV